ncbi:MAG: tail fiber domain-containing protein [Ferruginibacter sp.]
MKKVYCACGLLLLFTTQLKAQNIGIGTGTPNAQALMHVDLGPSTSKGFLITGTGIGGTIPDLGAGSRMMFYPGKAAFKAGYAYSTEWDDINTGMYSVSLGANTIASGYGSTALGIQTTAGASYSTAMGYLSTASGIWSTAMGYGSTAGAFYAVAAGHNATASGVSSFALGDVATASGDNSYAIGHNISTNGKKGSFFLADSDPYNKGVRVIGSTDQMACRFNGGYYFISSNSGADIGVQVLAGGNSWSVASDVRKKENFLPVDGEKLLQKIAGLSLTTWNYKGQDPKYFRHFGPMAQDFYADFGKDALGTIGCDTLINQQDLIGVDLIAVQALEKRTAVLNSENRELKNEVAALKRRLDKMEKKLNRR